MGLYEEIVKFVTLTARFCHEVSRFIPIKIQCMNHSDGLLMIKLLTEILLIIIHCAVVLFLLICLCKTCHLLRQKKKKNKINK